MKTATTGSVSREEVSATFSIPGVALVCTGRSRGSPIPLPGILEAHLIFLPSKEGPTDMTSGGLAQLWRDWFAVAGWAC